MDENNEMRPGEIFAGRYRIVELAGKGTSGQVYKATDNTTGEFVALKFLHGEHFKQADSARRFTREGRVLQAVSHPHLLKLHESGSFEGTFFHAMEWCSEGSLAENLMELSNSENSALQLMLQIALGLGALHGQGILHRDIKAGNVLVGSNGLLKLGDLGMARWDVEDIHGTRTGGTPSGMAPELWNGENPSVQSDIYALGVLFYEILTLSPPFEGSSIMEIIRCHMFDIPAPPSEEIGCSAEIESLIGCMLQKSPQDRPDSVAQIISSLNEIISGQESPTINSTDSQNTAFMHKQATSIVFMLVSCIIPCLLVAAQIHGHSRKDTTINLASYILPNKPQGILYTHLWREGASWKISSSRDHFELSSEAPHSITRYRVNPGENPSRKVLVEKYSSQISDQREKAFNAIVPATVKLQHERPLSPQAIWSVPELAKSEQFIISLSTKGREEADTPVFGTLNYFKNIKYLDKEDFVPGKAGTILESWPYMITHGALEELPADFTSIIHVASAVVSRSFFNCEIEGIPLPGVLHSRCQRFKDVIFGRDKEGYPLGPVMEVIGFIQVSSITLRHEFNIEGISVAKAFL